MTNLVYVEAKLFDYFHIKFRKNFFLLNSILIELILFFTKSVILMTSTVHLLYIKTKNI